jgi:hypothetical protein
MSVPLCGVLGLRDTHEGGRDARDRRGVRCNERREALIVHATVVLSLLAYLPSGLTRVTDARHVLYVIILRVRLAGARKCCRPGHPGSMLSSGGD